MDLLGSILRSSGSFAPNFGRL